MKILLVEDDTALRGALLLGDRSISASMPLIPEGDVTVFIEFIGMFIPRWAGIVVCFDYVCKLR